MPVLLVRRQHVVRAKIWVAYLRLGWCGHQHERYCHGRYCDDVLHLFYSSALVTVTVIVTCSRGWSGRWLKGPGAEQSEHQQQSRRCTSGEDGQVHIQHCNYGKYCVTVVSIYASVSRIPRELLGKLDVNTP